MINEIIFLFVLTLINGLFSMSEIAIVSSRKTRLELNAKKGVSGAKAALELANHPNRFLSTVQIGITLVAILIGMFSGATLNKPISDYLSTFSFIGKYAENIATGVIVVVITFVSLVFGELLPKRIGMSNPETIAQFVSPFMNLLSKITKPFIWFLSITTELFMRLFNIKVDESKVTEEEIKAIIDEGATAGTIEEIEQDIVERVFHLGDKRVGALMTHRNDIVWIDTNDPLQVSLEKIDEGKHAVYPVAEDELDKTLGIISVKDILSAQIQKTPIDFKNMVRAVNYFPENMSAYIALEKFKETKIHQALIVDEFGSIVGIVTINDLFDALVGDISQEDGEMLAYEKVQREDGSWLMDGQYPWDDFINDFDIDDDDYSNEGFHTVSGFILDQLKEIPNTGAIVTWNNFTFEVIDMDSKRIDKVLIKQIK